jgi:ATP-dependent RNA helicase RhlB
MVFVNTRRGAEEIESLLRGNGINAEAISGDVPQRKRLRMLRDFHEGTLAVLIGTDVASRGLHIPDVSHVFNYDLPQDPEDYVHRIGRTARAGAEGDAISFGCENYVMSLPDIEGYIGRKLPVAPVPVESLPEIELPQHRERHRFHERRQGNGHGRGPRRSHKTRGDRSHAPRAQEHAAARPESSAAAAGAQGTEQPAPRKRRRRRRGGPANERQGAPPPDSE